MTLCVTPSRLVEYALTREERARFESGLDAVPDVNANPSAAMRLLQREFPGLCPQELIDQIYDMKTNASGPSAIIIHNGPGCPLPETPRSGDSRGTHVSFVAHGYLAGMMIQFGHPICQIGQKMGALIADVVPRPGFERSISSAGFAQALDLHVEDVHLSPEERPTHVGLFCLKPDPVDRAETLLVDMRDIVPTLDAETLRELRQPNFVINQSESFAGGPSCSAPLPILSGPVDLPEVTAEFNTTRALTALAQVAFEKFKEVARARTVAVKLRERDLLIICNRRTMHGRGVFEPRFEAGCENRWLLRLCVVADPYRVRDGVALGGFRVLDVRASELRDLVVVTAAGVADIDLPTDSITVEAARACLGRYDRWLNQVGATDCRLAERLRIECAVFVAREIAQHRLVAFDGMSPDARVALAVALVHHVQQEAALYHQSPLSPPPEVDLTPLAVALGSGDMSTEELMRMATRNTEWLF